MLIVIILIIAIIVYWYYSNNSNNHSDSSHNNSDTVRLKLTDIDKNELLAGMPKDVFDKMQRAIMDGENSINIKKSDYDKILQKSKEYKKRNERIDECAYLNNKGIALEKEGNIQEAINIYEKNIVDEYPAIQSYERLMVLYRKNKDYDNELRVINTAIKAFGKENEARYNNAIKNQKNKKYLEEIQLANETNTGVKNDEGWYIFLPYNIMKYIERLEKVKKLIESNKK